jgi:dienelactone hydrolase
MKSIRDVEYRLGGLMMRGRLAVPEGSGPFPAVLIAPEATGLDEFQAGRAALFAELGFTNPGVDSYGQPGLRFDSVATQRSWRSMIDLFAEVF